NQGRRTGASGPARRDAGGTHLVRRTAARYPVRIGILAGRSTRADRAGILRRADPVGTGGPVPNSARHSENARPQRTAGTASAVAAERDRTMTSAEHEELRNSLGLYVLGALTPAERAEVQAHLVTCEECAAGVRSLQMSANAIALTVDPVDPPAHVRQRLL